MGKRYMVEIEELGFKSIVDIEKGKSDVKEEKKLKKEKQKLEKQREARRRKKERKETRGSKLLIWVIVGSFLLISVSIIFMNYKICFASAEGASMSSSEKIESTLLSNGLTIIGFAISVWAGLNIVQLLEKGKLEALGNEVATYRRERCELNKRNFFNNLIALDDALNRHLYKLFSEIEDESDNLATFYFECNKIELRFHNIYQKQKYIIRNLPIQYYEDTLNDINRLLKQIENSDCTNMDLFVKYLKIRLAEVYFYLGYNVDADESIECFSTVIAYFCEMFEELNNPVLMMNNRKMLFGDVELTAYMFNTMGEAYSKIIIMIFIKFPNVEQNFMNAL